MTAKEQFSALMRGYIPDEMFSYLTFSGYFEAPAAMSHHGNYPGGLYDHSYAVTESLLFLSKRLGLKWQEKRSPYIVGMFHDLCKLDDYKKVNGVWQRDEKARPGHGEKSWLMLALHMDLTEEEMFCIRWHMGAFDDKAKWKCYTKAIARYPNVLYTHTADMIASQVMGV